MTLKTVTFLCKTISTHWYKLIKEYKSIVNGWINTISDKTLYKLHVTNIIKKRFFDHHPVTSIYDMKTYAMLFVKN